MTTKPTRLLLFIPLFVKTQNIDQNHEKSENDTFGVRMENEGIKKALN